ncbi:alpha-1,2-fucosyltransferase [Chitinophaga caseinilytica]|uniref:alpha-1,2-fucosyltransferase n=1 Tax=Chitinophaga caseinilytica TaxID=2267521 RepID=UPI003C301C9D
MVIINISGGIGNQMFQYAFGRYLSILFQKQLLLNMTAYENNGYRKFGLQTFQLAPKCRIVNRDEILLQDAPSSEYLQIDERFYHFNQELVDLLRQMSEENSCCQTRFLVSGYWQSEKYFKDIRPILKTDFGFRFPLVGQAKVLLNKIKSENSVMIHVRRGDYLYFQDKYCIVSKEYLLSAIQYCWKELQSPVFYVFSDDISWCKENLHEVPGLTFMGDELYDEHSKSYLQLMCACHHFILSNSTFGWWAAWLGDHPGKITIAPGRWFNDELTNAKDVYCDDWIIM